MTPAVAITMAAAHGELELNAFFPLIADSLLESLRLLIRAADLLREKCVDLLEADQDACARHLDASFAFATAYAAELGYDAVLLNTAVAKAADPVAMAGAFRLAVEAGRTAYEAGLMEARDFASPSTPVVGTPFWHAVS